MIEFEAENDLSGWWTGIYSAAADRQEAVDQAFQTLDRAGLVSKVVVHRYRCRKRGCLLATVIRIGDVVIARTTAYKLGTGLNLHSSVPAARRNNTLDGKQHWPGYTYDVERAAGYGPHSGLTVACRDVSLTSIIASDVLNIVSGVRAGHPGPPTLL